MNDYFNDPYLNYEESNDKKPVSKTPEKSPKGKKSKNSVLPFVIIGCIFSFLVMLLGFSCNSACNSTAQEKRFLNQKVSSLEEKVKQQESEIDDLTRRLTSRDKQYETASSELQALKSPSSQSVASTDTTDADTNQDTDYTDEDSEYTDQGDYEYTEEYTEEDYYEYSDYTEE